MLAILTTHPIQYQTPIWQALAADGRVPFEVWFLTNHALSSSHDREFGAAVAWDLDMLSGYQYRFLHVADGARPDSWLQCRLVEDLEERLCRSKAHALWIQGWQVSAYWQSVAAARRARVPVWLRGESNDLRPTSVGKSFVKRIALRRLFAGVSEFLYIGEGNRRLYESFGIDRDHLHPAPYAIDNDRFRRQADIVRPRRREIRRSWGIDDDAFCILFCGKFIEKKRPLDLVAAVRRLTLRGLRWKPHLLFVGSGKLGSKLRTACKPVYDGEGVANTRDDKPADGIPMASFAGFLNQTEISAAYVAADCLVLPSDYNETWGLVVNEALASGLPAVASAACGCAEDMLSHAMRPSTFAVGDTIGLGELLADIYENRDGYAPSQRTLEWHDFSTTVEQVCRLYESRSEVCDRSRNV